MNFNPLSNRPLKIYSLVLLLQLLKGFPTEIRVNLDELVKSRDITMYRLAKDTGVTYPTLWKLQRGRAQRIGFDVIEKICVYLQCTPGDLLSVIPEKSGKKQASKKVSESGKK